MGYSSPANYIRVNRRRSGLTQQELAEVLGLISEWQISEHERSGGVPLFLTAISYEIVFDMPISKLFPGIYETVRTNIDNRLAELEARLHMSTAKGRAAVLVARKIEWLTMRRNLPSEVIP